uniref:Amine oxidase domain-containing protein n=1 Tax=Tetradesmus obliquus TaxID=3088 RepID=A0A383W742_TETOB|eukprot:jgi/Sobl393_1/19683/SZX72516.1
MALSSMLLLLVALCSRLAAAQSTPAYDVIVIGAGVAGLKAASDLRQANLRVLVLEARSRPYGRIDTQQPAGWPVSIELGAQWFHGSSNPVLAYARTLRNPSVTITSTGSGDDEATFNPATGEEVSAADDTRWEDWFTEFEDSILPDLQEADGANSRSVADAMNDFMTVKRINDPLQRRGFLSRIETNYVQEYAASANRLSLPYFNADSEMAGGDSVPSNYSSVFSRMVNAIQQSPSSLRLGMVVSSVTPLRASAGSAVVGVQVAATNTRTQRSETITGRFLLSTLPLGVLKASYRSIFAAGIDAGAAARQKAIAALGMGLLNKVIMQFPTAFWTSKDLAGSNQWIGSLPLEDPAAVQWNEFFSLKQTTGQNVLVAFQAGDAAATVEKLGDKETVDSAMVALRQMFGNPSLPNPTRYVITRWAQDPYALGSYSFVAVGATDGMRNALCRTAGRLYFAVTNDCSVRGYATSAA